MDSGGKNNAPAQADDVVASLAALALDDDDNAGGVAVAQVVTHPKSAQCTEQISVTQADALAAFVSLYEGRYKQRSADWLAARERQIGSSELAALMGMNPYQGKAATVATKAGLQGWGGGGPACWWGTFFESAAEAMLAVDAGVELLGTDISVPAPFAGHAGSPDGYCVARVCWNSREGRWEIVPAPAPSAAGTPAPSADGSAGVPADPDRGEVTEQVLLLEFKCPHRRRPRGTIPEHYLPQLWSGLALAPLTHRALFVDTVFRRCSIEDLGPGPAYDRWYHVERTTKNQWVGAFAWGISGVYAPYPGVVPAMISDGDASDADAAVDDLVAGGSAPASDDPAYTAWAISTEYFGSTAMDLGPVDLGSCPPVAFDKVLGLVADSRKFPYVHVGPCFADGRGVALRTDNEIGEAIDTLTAGAPPGYYLLGFLPWKILETNYIFAERKPNFLEEVRPLVEDALDLAAKIRSSADPLETYRALFANAEEAGARADGVPVRGASADEVQDMFDWLAGPG